MFEFESKNFILTIGAMLLLSGAIIFYFQNRVGSLEKAIAKQNQVLSSFIANVQSELRGAGPPMVQAPQSAPGPPERCDIPSDKIEVSSDDYDSDSDSDSSNTSSDEDAGIRIGEEEPDVKVIEMLNEAQDIIKDQENAVNVTEVLLNDMIPQDMTNGSNDISATDLLENNNDDEDDDDEDDDDEDDDDDDDDEDDDEDDDTGSPQADDIDVKKIVNVGLDAPVDYNAEKKNVLIQFCKEKGLGDEAMLKRYKKQELVNLLSSA